MMICPMCHHDILYPPCPVCAGRAFPGDFDDPEPEPEPPPRAQLGGCAYCHAPLHGAGRLHQGQALCEACWEHFSMDDPRHPYYKPDEDMP